MDEERVRREEERRGAPRMKRKRGEESKGTHGRRKERREGGR